MISILETTSEEYCKAIEAALGKGKQHALILYHEWFREGTFTGHHPAFNNAQELLKQIQHHTLLPQLEKSIGLEDGATEKILFKTVEGYEIESVVIPMEAGGTVCVSSQVGCKMGCHFCETGRMGLLKNLTVSEIVGQLFYIKHFGKYSFRNIVFMGMGEPFDNYDTVLKAFRVINDPHGLNIGAKHITISTSGRVDGILRYADEEGPIPNLAVSLTAPNDDLRSRLVPINRKYNLASLYEAMQHYQVKKKRSILIAYVLLKDVNDSTTHAEELAHYLKGLDVKVNLIPYNPQRKDRFATPTDDAVMQFKKLMMQNGYETFVRATKGDKIMAACGQLGKKLRLSTSYDLST